MIVSLLPLSVVPLVMVRAMAIMPGRITSNPPSTSRSIFTDGVERR